MYDINEHQAFRKLAQFVLLIWALQNCELLEYPLKQNNYCHVRVALLAAASSPFAKAARSIPDGGTKQQQPMNV